MRPISTSQADISDIERLRARVAEMGGRAEVQLADAVEALLRRDADAARRVIERDKAIDATEIAIEKEAMRILALRPPLADDLREIVSALKITNIVERIADYGTNVAKRSTVLVNNPVREPLHTIREMALRAQQMIKDALDAYAEHDSDKAVDVWNRDRDIDELYNSLFRELLTHMMENPANITPCIHLMFIAKNIERIGDHATNLAEIVYYLARGEMLGSARPKSDITSFTEFVVPDDKTTGRG